MSSIRPHEPRSGRRVLAACSLAALCTLAFLGGPATGDAAAGTVSVLGAGPRVGAACPANCLVEARVTGFQSSLGRVRKPFVAPKRGRIVAWSAKLGRPRRPDLRFFNRSFGRPKARIAVLRPYWRAGANGRTRMYRLLRQSPAVDLQPFLGSTVTFALKHPLRIKRHQVVALTIPSWAPVFASARVRGARWLASRAASEARGGCTTSRGTANVRVGGPHESAGTGRRYGCAYIGTRLLYSARFVAG